MGDIKIYISEFILKCGLVSAGLHCSKVLFCMENNVYYLIYKGGNVLTARESSAVDWKLIFISKCSASIVSAVN